MSNRYTSVALIACCCLMSASPAVAHPLLFDTDGAGLSNGLEGCSWPGPDPDWILARTLPTVDLTGSLGSEVLDFLRQAGAPISFIARNADDPEVRVQRAEAITIRQLVADVMEQAPGYRLDVVSDKLVIYPLNEGFDTLVDLGDPYAANRAGALLSVLRQLDSKVPRLRGLRSVLRGPLGEVWGELISVGGARTVIEHLASLVADNPSLTFAIIPRADGVMDFDLLWSDVIEVLLLEAPGKVEVGKEFRVVPRVILAGGMSAPLIGSGCGVRYQSLDDSTLLTIDQGGRAVAMAKGTASIFAKYQARGTSVEVEVTDD